MGTTAADLVVASVVCSGSTAVMFAPPFLEPRNAQRATTIVRAIADGEADTLL